MSEANDFYRSLMDKAGASAGLVMKLGLPHFSPVGAPEDYPRAHRRRACSSPGVSYRYVRLSARIGAGPEVELFAQNHRPAHDVQRSQEIRVHSGPAAPIGLA